MDKWLRALLCVFLVIPLGIEASCVFAVTENDIQLDSSQTSMFESATGTSNNISGESTISSSSQSSIEPSTEQSSEDVKNWDNKPSKKVNSIGPQATYLIEGVDIDATFAMLLRTNMHVTNLGASFPGFGKGIDQLTIEDMESITTISFSLVNSAITITSLEGIKYAKNVQLIEVENRNLVDLDVSNLSKLETLYCSNNEIESLTVDGCSSLKNFYCERNKLTELDVSTNTNLRDLRAAANHISDITSCLGLNQLYYMNFNQQTFEMDVPVISNGQTTIDLLKTSAVTDKGLNLTNTDIQGSPVLSANGDIIELSNVSVSALNGRSFRFDYTPTKLVEGMPNQTKQFSGIIKFNVVSDLENILKPNIKKVPSGEEVEWQWTIRGNSPKKAENIRATLNLPGGLIIDPGSIMINGITGSLADINGAANHGDLNENETLEISFKTTANGNAGDWLKAVGQLDWEDDLPTSPRTNQSFGEIQIIDVEQTHTPQETKDLALLSTPVSFRFGVHELKNTSQIVLLGVSDYQTNTQVVTNGFYTRMRDDRSTNTGWKLTAQLSDFTDNSNTLMPNSAGTSLRMEDMTIESILDRDTSQETIDPSPSGIPSMVTAAETLVAGQAAKTLVSAQANEGIGTWQLRMPFDKVSLNLPANAGERSRNYTAKLTWSLNDTP